jgi:hypothetical protein
MSAAVLDITDRVATPRRGLSQSCARSLRAENKSPRTVRAYLGAVVLFSTFVLEHGLNT